VGTVTLVRLHDTFTSIIDVSSSRGIITFSPAKEFTENYDIVQYLKSKKKIYLVFSTENSYEESITLPSVITNEVTIKTAILAKIQEDDRIHEKLLFNRLYTTVDASGESANHRFEGVVESEVLDAISVVPNLEFVRRISTHPYALFSLTESIFSGKSYLCVYAQENKNLIIAVSGGVLLFSRVGVLQSDDEIEKIMEQISDINRTVAYAHQQYREAKFEFIVLSGIIADGEMTSEQLYNSTGLRITVLAPTLMVKGLDKAIAQNFIPEMGMVFLGNTMNFLPDRVKAAREFYLGGLIALGLAFFFMLFGVFQGYGAYETYQESLDTYSSVESQLFRTLKKTDTLDDKELQEIIAQLKSSTPLHHHILDELIVLDKVLQLSKPASVIFDESKKSLVLEFRHQSKNLMELYLFEKQFKNTVEMLQKSDMIAAYKIDYNTFVFGATLTVGQIAPVENAPVRRRRR
jgi:hypothetical protein